MSVKNVFAKNLKELRKKKNLTQEQLAEIVGVAPRHISFIETARSFPSSDLIERLCKALDTDYMEIFKFEETISRTELTDRIISILNHLNDKDLKYLYKMASAL